LIPKKHFEFYTHALISLLTPVEFCQLLFFQLAEYLGSLQNSDPNTFLRNDYLFLDMLTTLNKNDPNVETTKNNCVSYLIVMQKYLEAAKLLKEQSPKIEILANASLLKITFQNKETATTFQTYRASILGIQPTFELELDKEIKDDNYKTEKKDKHCVIKFKQKTTVKNFLTQHQNDGVVLISQDEYETIVQIGAVQDLLLKPAEIVKETNLEKETEEEKRKRIEQQKLQALKQKEKKESMLAEKTAYQAFVNRFLTSALSSLPPFLLYFRNFCFSFLSKNLDKNLALDMSNAFVIFRSIAKVFHGAKNLKSEEETTGNKLLLIPINSQSISALKEKKTKNPWHQTLTEFAAKTAEFNWEEVKKILPKKEAQLSLPVSNVLTLSN